MKKSTSMIVAAALSFSLVPTAAFGLERTNTAAPVVPSVSQQCIRAGLGIGAGMGMQSRSAKQDAQDSVLRISEPGTYTLTGNMRGTVRVDPGAGDVTLVMDNVTIDGNGGPAIMGASGSKITVSLPEGTQSRVFSAGGAPGCMGTIQSDVPLFFEGPGALEVVGNFQPGIQTTNSDLTFNDGNFRFIDNGNGMATAGDAPGALTFNGGDFAFGVGGANMQAGGEMNRNGGSFGQFEGSANNFASYVAQNPWNGGFQGMQQSQQGVQPGQQGAQSGQQGAQPGQQGAQQGLTGTTDTAGEIVEGIAENSAANLVADLDNATTYNVSDSSDVTIKSSGTYVVTGTSSNGNITVKKGTTGVVLVLENLDLTSTTGATLSINKEAEVQVVIKGKVTLTDNENPDDENSADEAVADAFDGAAIKAKAGSQVYITGTDGSTLTINGNAKNGIKAGDDSSLIIDGGNITINAANDGINGNYDVSLLSGNITISAGDDGVHADHILTIGKQDGTGPAVNVTNSTEDLEGTVVNIFGGDVSVKSSDDAINAANGDGAYEGELDYSINMTGGNVSINSQGDGMDSNGNVNLVGGSANISSASNGGEAGIDYDGNLYVSDDFRLDNNSGVSGADMPMGQGGQMGQGAPMGQGGMQGGMRR